MIKMSWQSILKSYELEEFIIKDEKKKKKVTEKKKKTKETIKLPNGDEAEVDFVPEFDNVIDALEHWKDKCESVTVDNIGMTGHGASGRLSIRTLFEVLDKHVTAEVKRPPRKDYGPGIKPILDKLIKIIKDKDLLEQKNLEAIETYTEGLKRVGRPKSKTNPRNIPFTVPDVIGKEGAESWKTVYGHYRTPEYVKHRKAQGKEESIAGKESWYSKSKGEASYKLFNLC